MRKHRLALVAVLFTLIAAGLFAWRFTADQTPAYVSEAFGANPREALQKELASPGSVWAEAMRNPADLARFKDAPAYRIDLDYDAPARRLKGKEAILYTNTTDSQVEALYLSTGARAWGDANLGDDNFSLTGLRVDGHNRPYTQKDLYGQVHLQRPVKPGESIVIEFSFTARIPSAKPPQGTWTMDPKEVPPTFGGNGNLADGLTEAIPWLTPDVAPLLDTAAAMTAAPTWSLVDLRIVLPPRWRVISSGTRVEEVSIPDRGTTSRIVGASYSFYLFATSRMGEVRGEKNGVTIAVNYPAFGEAVAREALEDAARFIELYDQMLGPYPFTELEIMPIVPGQTFAGMNRSGLVFIKADFFIEQETVLPAAITDPQLRRLLGADPYTIRVWLLSHEIAHAWWGDLAWPDHAQSPWWLETMTEATALAGLEKAFGEEVANQQRERDTFSFRVGRAQGLPDHAYGRPPTEHERNIQYLSMTYLRPALFYDKVRHQVGDEAFFAAMRRYLDKGRFTVRSDRGPVEELMAARGVEGLWQRWMLETNGDEDLGALTPEQARQLGIVK